MKAVFRTKTKAQKRDSPHWGVTLSGLFFVHKMAAFWDPVFPVAYSSPSWGCEDGFNTVRFTLVLQCSVFGFHFWYVCTLHMPDGTSLDRSCRCCVATPHVPPPTLLTCEHCFGRGRIPALREGVILPSLPTRLPEDGY